MLAYASHLILYVSIVNQLDACGISLFFIEFVILDFFIGASWKDGCEVILDLTILYNDTSSKDLVHMERSTVI